MTNLIKEERVKITIDSDTIEGDLTLLPDAQGIVLFAHGAGSSRHSPRNNFVGDQLILAGLATLLIDLLTPQEKKIDKHTRETRFDSLSISKRVTGTVDWLAENDATKSLKIGIFGSSTDSAGGLIACSRRPKKVTTVVSRGGRVDLAKGYYKKVACPVLCIVGGQDIQVLEINRQAVKNIDT